MEKPILKRLYLIRHGETDPNKNQIIQGSGLDAPLNATGRQQALLFHSFYNAVSFDAVYTSALQRTWQSIQSFIDQGIVHTVLPELNEISWGAKDGTRINPTEQGEYEAMLQRWANGELDQKFPGGESPKEVALRLRQGLAKIMENKMEATILISMHGRAMRIFLCLLLKIPISKMEQFLHSNLCLYILDWDGQDWDLRLSNDTRHLKQNSTISD